MDDKVFIVVDSQSPNHVVAVCKKIKQAKKAASDFYQFHKRLPRIWEAKPEFFYIDRFSREITY